MYESIENALKVMLEKGMQKRWKREPEWSRNGAETGAGIHRKPERGADGRPKVAEGSPGSHRKEHGKKGAEKGAEGASGLRKQARPGGMRGQYSLLAFYGPYLPLLAEV